MREILYTKDAYETVVLDTQQILEAMHLLGRTYSITFVYFKENSNAKSFISDVSKLDSLMVNKGMGIPVHELSLIHISEPTRPY